MQTGGPPEESLTVDGFLGGRILLAQPKQGHRSGSDAVFLAAAVPARPGEQALEAGAGAGVAALCLLARVPSLHLTAVEFDAELGGIAEANAVRNGFAGQMRVVTGDVTAPGEDLYAKGVRREHYQQVFANPPFYVAGTVRPAPEPGRAFAHVIGDGGLKDWLRFLATVAAADGQLTLIHRPESLSMLLELLDRRFGDVCIFPLFPKEGAPASRIVLQGRKGSRAPLRLLPGLVLHRPDGSYTDKAEAILRGGEALRLLP